MNSHGEAHLTSHYGHLVVCNLEELGHLAAVGPLLASIWGGGGSPTAMPVNLLVAILHSGGYVGGAFDDGELVAASVGFLAMRNGVIELHSHVTGVTVDFQSSGVGRALKEHQRRWAASQGIAGITWTFDPLSRRNGWFNLVKLGARAVSYHPNFYGEMPDAQNGNDETDRCMAYWSTGEPFPQNALRTPAGHESQVALEVGVDDRPVRVPADLDSPVIACQVPQDIVSIRKADPTLARSWRLELRAVMGSAMRAGYIATSITGDGVYSLLHASLLEAPTLASQV